MSSGPGWLRSQEAAALNAVVERCRKAADLYEDAAGRVDEESLARLFRQLMRERERLATQLEHHVRRLGEPPADPDPDAETLHRLLNAARAALASRADRPLLEDRARAEEELSRALDDALRTDLPDAVRRLLENAREGVADARRELRAAAERA